jgi:hypothetical protein
MAQPAAAGGCVEEEGNEIMAEMGHDPDTRR